jgi:hypothetical protein
MLLSITDRHKGGRLGGESKVTKKNGEKNIPITVLLTNTREAVSGENPRWSVAQIQYLKTQSEAEMDASSSTDSPKSTLRDKGEGLGREGGWVGGWGGGRASHSRGIFFSASSGGPADGSRNRRHQR